MSGVLYVSVREIPTGLLRSIAIPCLDDSVHHVHGNYENDRGRLRSLLDDHCGVSRGCPLVLHYRRPCLWNPDPRNVLLAHVSHRVLVCDFCDLLGTLDFVLYRNAGLSVRLEHVHNYNTRHRNPGAETGTRLVLTPRLARADSGNAEREA